MQVECHAANVRRPLCAVAPVYGQKPVRVSRASRDGRGIRGNAFQPFARHSDAISREGGCKRADFLPPSQPVDYSFPAQDSWRL